MKDWQRYWCLKKCQLQSELKIKQLRVVQLNPQFLNIQWKYKQTTAYKNEVNKTVGSDCRLNKEQN